ncbi:hypothetical protein [Flavobacterium eburneipallidum]|uniref:hypothetical protein n=1 Tax=Flavobacterium eburneipallidum TaxID=3003263 RepID=UPI0024825AD6|nr:hypothetical protein [Flavobacterium eburneipallidum]
MKVYDLKGVLVEGKKAVIAVYLPIPKKNAYNIFNIYNISDAKENKIVIHLKDFSTPPLVVTDNNLESFIIELNTKEFDSFDFAKETRVALIHHNADDLPGKPEEIFNEAHVKSIEPNVAGTGIIRP